LRPLCGSAMSQQLFFEAVGTEGLLVENSEIFLLGGESLRKAQKGQSTASI
jgi:hypothetical protein